MRPKITHETVSYEFLRYKLRLKSNKPKIKLLGDPQHYGQTENSQKFSLFQIFSKIECSRVPIHFKVTAAGAAHPLRDECNLIPHGIFKFLQN